MALLVCASACFAQSPEDLFNKPPADVDQALRARITEFFQDHVEGKFREAEALVAEDSKDFYYNSSKTKYLSFQIVRIAYSENFTRAKATMLCEQYFLIPGFEHKPMKAPLPSTWKVVNGQWYWYVDQDALLQTPFGKMKPGPGGQAGASPPSIQSLDDVKKFIFSQVKADKQAVTVKADQPETVTITNGANGAISLTLMAVPSGIEAKLDRASLAAGEKAILTVRAGDKPHSGVLSIRVDQTNQMIPIQVAFQ